MKLAFTLCYGLLFVSSEEMDWLSSSMTWLWYIKKWMLFYWYQLCYIRQSICTVIKKFWVKSMKVRKSNFTDSKFYINLNFMVKESKDKVHVLYVWVVHVFSFKENKVSSSFFYSIMPRSNSKFHHLENAFSNILLLLLNSIK